MEICQYEFQFQNEFMGELEQKIGDLFEITISPENMFRVDKEKQSFILRKKDNKNFMLFSAHQASFVYLLVVRCEKIYEERLKDILLKICEEIEDDYGEDHRKEVEDVIAKADNRFSNLEEKYKINELLGIY